MLVLSEYRKLPWPLRHLLTQYTRCVELPHVLLVEVWLGPVQPQVHFVIQYSSKENLTLGVNPVFVAVFQADVHSDCILASTTAKPVNGWPRARLEIDVHRLRHYLPKNLYHHVRQLNEASPGGVDPTVDARPWWQQTVPGFCMDNTRLADLVAARLAALPHVAVDQEHATLAASVGVMLVAVCRSVQGQTLCPATMQDFGGQLTFHTKSLVKGEATAFAQQSGRNIWTVIGEIWSGPSPHIKVEGKLVPLLPGPASNLWVRVRVPEELKSLQHHYTPAQLRLTRGWAYLTFEECRPLVATRFQALYETFLYQQIVPLIYAYVQGEDPGPLTEFIQFHLRATEPIDSTDYPTAVRLPLRELLPLQLDTPTLLPPCLQTLWRPAQTPHSHIKHAQRRALTESLMDMGYTGPLIKARLSQAYAHNGSSHHSAKSERDVLIIAKDYKKPFASRCHILNMSSKRKQERGSQILCPFTRDNYMRCIQPEPVDIEDTIPLLAMTPAVALARRIRCQTSMDCSG